MVSYLDIYYVTCNEKTAGFKKEIFMAKMTEEEAIAVSDYFINNKVTLGPDGSGWLSQRELRLLGLNKITVNYLLTKAIALHKTPAQIIDELVGEKLAASSL